MKMTDKILKMFFEKTLSPVGAWFLALICIFISFYSLWYALLLILYFPIAIIEEYVERKIF